MKPFKNKTAFISGASKGIGYACALRLAEGGANVFLSSSSEERLKKASEKIKQKTGAHPTILLDDVFAKLDINRSKKLVSYLDSIKSEEKDPLQTIITTTDILNVEQSGLILDSLDVETHKLELCWNT